MAEETGSWHRMVRAGDLPEGEIFAARVGEVHVAVYNVGGAFFATENICTHAFALLSDGWLAGATVECPLHGAQFDVQTGKALDGPAECDLRTFPTRVNGGQVEVLLG